MAITDKPIIIMPPFEDNYIVCGMGRLAKDMWEQHFQVVYMHDLTHYPDLHDKIEGVLVAPYFDRALFEIKTWDKMAKLRVVCTLSAGYEHLDVAYLKSRDIR